MYLENIFAILLHYKEHTRKLLSINQYKNAILFIFIGDINYV